VLPDAGPHDHFEMVTSHGILRLNDPRRFGAVVYASSEDSDVARKLLGHLGMEPLSDDFDLRVFQAGLKVRRTAIKQVLLAGDVVVGVGNIYACEALFLAGIRPTVRASRLSGRRIARLAPGDPSGAGACGGARWIDTARLLQCPWRQRRVSAGSDGVRPGGPGLPGVRSPVRSIRQGQRSTFFCHTCQRI
jgi:formamidopyrimidine-DNA glycosylase